MLNPTDCSAALDFSSFYTKEQLRKDDIKVLEAALERYMTALRDAGHLAPVKFTERRDHRWANAWNRFVGHAGAPESKWDVASIIEPIQHGLNIVICGCTPDDAYARMVKKMNTGCFEFRAMHCANSVCDASGKTLGVNIQAGWKPQIGTVNYKLDDAFLPLTEDGPLPSVKMGQIPAPTGNMLLADWFRFKENLFSDIVKVGAPEGSLNTSAGCAALTDHYAANFGFMSVHVGNTSPEILQRPDHLVIGRFDEDACLNEDDKNSPALLQGEVKGYVCTDLWWATMIDRSVLIDLLATKIGREQAERDVAACIEEFDITTVQVPPGQVFFHYTAQKDDLASFFCEGPLEVNRDAVDEPYVVISSEPLTWGPVVLPCDEVHAPIPSY